MNDVTCAPCLQANHRRCVLGFKCACSICKTTRNRTNSMMETVKTEATAIIEKPETPTEKDDAPSKPRSFSRPLDPREIRVAHIMLENGASDFELMQSFKISQTLAQSLHDDWNANAHLAPRLPPRD